MIRGLCNLFLKSKVMVFADFPFIGFGFAAQNLKLGLNAEAIRIAPNKPKQLPYYYGQYSGRKLNDS